MGEGEAMGGVWYAVQGGLIAMAPPSEGDGT